MYLIPSSAGQVVLKWVIDETGREDRVVQWLRALVAGLKRSRFVSQRVQNSELPVLPGMACGSLTSTNECETGLGLAFLFPVLCSHHSLWIYDQLRGYIISITAASILLLKWSEYT